MACDMPDSCKFPSLDICQKRFLWTHKEVDLAPHPVVGLLLRVGDTEKFPHALNFEGFDSFFRVSKLEDGSGEAVVACDMPEPCKFLSLDSCQKRFLRTHKEVDPALYLVAAWLLGWSSEGFHCTTVGCLMTNHLSLNSTQFTLFG